MACAPEPTETEDFETRPLCRFKVTENEYDTKTVSLLATSHLFGLVFVGTPEKILVIRVSDLIKIDQEIVSKKTEISTFPSKNILLPSSPCFVSLSSDNLTLMVCLQKSGCPVGWMYDVRGFARQSGEWNPFQEIRLSSTEGTTVTDCAWNPTMPGLVAVCLSDGSLVAVEVNNTQFTINSLPSSTGAQAISWSPKGKQLVVAGPGKLVQYKPDLILAKTIPFSGTDVKMKQPAICGLQWLSTSQFLVTFVDESDPNSRPHVNIVNVQRTGPPTFIDYDDICFGDVKIEKPHRYLTLGLPSWNILLASSTKSMEIALLEQFSAENADTPEWRQIMLSDSNRAELPMNLDNRQDINDTGEETQPIGMAIDLTSQTPLPLLDNETLPPMPILFVLSTHGRLCPFHLLNLKKDAVMLNQPPQPISDTNERPGLSGIKVAPTVPLAASTPLPPTSRMAIPRTNLLTAFSNNTPTTTASGMKTTGTDSFFSKPPAQPVGSSISVPQPAPTPAPTASVAPVSTPFKSVQVEVPNATQKPSVPAPVKISNQSTAEDSSMGAADAILRDEVIKFAQELQDFKHRSANLKVTVSNDEVKDRLLKRTAELSEFGVDLVDTTKSQDEDVRSLCTELVEVAALLEDARVRLARRKNSRYSHLLKLRPLDPSSRRKMDGIERLNAHIEQQLVEASRHLDSRDRTRDQNRKIEIPITQVIYEAIKNNAKVISQLKSRVERIKTRSKEQQLKLAGAAFEALRPMAYDDSSKWESELALLADTLLTSRIRGEGENQVTPVIPQVSPEKQAMLRNVLAHRPVARIRAVRPESAAESRLLSNLSGLMLSEDKRDVSSTSQTSSTSKSGLLGSSSPGVGKTQTPKSIRNGVDSHRLPNQDTAKQELKTTATFPQATQVEDITPPSSPLNLEQTAKAIGNQPMMSSLSFTSSVPATTSIETKPIVTPAEVKPAVPIVSQPSVSKPSFGVPTSNLGLSFGGSNSSSNTSSMFSQSSFASAFATAVPPTSTAAASSKPITTSASLSFGAPNTSTTLAATVSSQAPQISKAPSFSFASPSVSSAVGSTPTSKPVETTVPLKTSFSFISTAATLPASTVATPVTTQLPSPPSTTFSFASTALPPAKPVSTPTTSAPFSLVAPLSAPSSITPVSTSVTASSTVTSTAAPASFSFSLAKTTTANSSSATPVTTAPFTFNLSGTAATTSTAATTPSVFAGGFASTSTSAPLFSLSSTAVAPKAFGVVPSTATSTSSPVGFGQTSVAPAPASTTPALGSLFGQPTSANTSTGGLTSLLGQSKLAAVSSVPATTNQVATSDSTATAASNVSSTPAPSGLFGSQSTSVGNTAAPLFGQATNSAAASSFGGSAFGQSVFGQPASTAISSATATAPLFGQSTFGKPLVPTAPQSQVVVSAASAFGAAPVFGQSSGTSTGLLAGSVFGQNAASSAATPAKPVFGGSVFGQTPTNNANQVAAAATSPAPVSGFGSGLFSNMGLGGTPNPTNANRNAFGGGTVFGSGTPSSQGTFGSTTSAFGSQPAGPVLAPPPSFGSPGGAGFGAFGQNQSQSQPAFGGAATFGGSPLFGSKPTFGGGPTFGSPVSSMGAAKPEAGFGAFAAASNVPTFGVLANTGPSFGTLANSGNAQPAFGGAAFPASNPPSFGGGSSFSSWR